MAASENQFKYPLLYKSHQLLAFGRLAASLTRVVLLFLFNHMCDVRMKPVEFVGLLNHARCHVSRVTRLRPAYKQYLTSLYFRNLRKWITLSKNSEQLEKHYHPSNVFVSTYSVGRNGFSLSHCWGVLDHCFLWKMLFFFV